MNVKASLRRMASTAAVILGGAVIALGSATVASADTGTVTPATSSQLVTTTPLAVGYTANPANSSNWVAIVPRGVKPKPGNYDPTAWDWARSASGSVSLNTSGLKAGAYDVYLLQSQTAQSDGTYLQVAGPSPLDVTPGTGTVTPATSSQLVTTTPLAVNYTAAPANNGNWVAIVPRGVKPAPGNYDPTAWDWARSASGAVSLNTSGLKAGAYDVYLLQNQTAQSDGTYVQVAGPSPLDVTPGTGTVNVTNPVIPVGTSPSPVTYTAAPANSGNWIAIVPKGVKPAPGNYNTTAWDWARSASGSVSLNTSGLAVGQYDVYLLQNQTAQSDGTYVQVAGPSSLTVVDPRAVPVADPAVAGVTVAAGLAGLVLLRRHRARRVPTV